MHLKWALIAIIWTVLVIFLCLTDQNLEGSEYFSFQGKDKLVHIVFYTVMVYLWLRSILKIRHRNIWITITLIGVFGIIIEVFQEVFTINRCFDWYDILH